jgi:hypothetical protein
MAPSILDRLYTHLCRTGQKEFAKELARLQGEKYSTEGLLVDAIKLLLSHQDKPQVDKFLDDVCAEKGLAI